MPQVYNLGAIAALFSLCTPFSVGEMRILAPQNLVDAHAGRPIASARLFTMEAVRREEMLSY